MATGCCSEETAFLLGSERASPGPWVARDLASLRRCTPGRAAARFGASDVGSTPANGSCTSNSSLKVHTIHPQRREYPCIVRDCQTSQDTADFLSRPPDRLLCALIGHFRHLHLRRIPWNDCAPSRSYCCPFRSLRLTTSPPPFLKMLQIFKEIELAIPSEVTVTLHARKATVSGPRGELTKVRMLVMLRTENGERRATRIAIARATSWEGGGTRGQFRGAGSCDRYSHGGRTNCRCSPCDLPRW